MRAIHLIITRLSARICDRAYYSLGTTSRPIWLVILRVVAFLNHFGSRTDVSLPDWMEDIYTPGNEASKR